MHTSNLNARKRAHQVCFLTVISLVFLAGLAWSDDDAGTKTTIKIESIQRDVEALHERLKDLKVWQEELLQQIKQLQVVARRG